jgi:conjugal transfer pilus assembly protein TraA
MQQAIFSRFAAPQINAKQFTVAAVGAAFLLAAMVTIAGTDTTFSGPVNTLTSWLTGTMGRMFAIGALAVGLAIGIVKQSVLAVAVAVGIALAANAGPAVLGAIFSGTL